MIILRDYQIKIVKDARQLMLQGCKSILIQAPTGSGKTALTAHMLKTASERGMNSFFIVHRRELIKQSIATFEKVGVNHGVVAAGFEVNTEPHVQIAGVASLVRRLGQYRSPRLIIWDECHHLAAGSWARIFQTFPDAYHIGLSATPERLDGKGLSDYFQRIIQGPSVSWLIEEGFLSRYRAFAPAGVDLSNARTSYGDFVKSDLVAAVDRPTITGSAINEYRRRANGKRNVVFCSSVEHSKHVVAEFNSQGIPALHVDGECAADFRDWAIKQFEEGQIKVLSNVDLFGEGFDLPAIECVTLLRPTKSLGLYLQQVGRALRPSPGKTEAIILDHVQNIQTHGLPDEPREWSLDGHGATRKSESTGSVRICPQCFAAQMSGPGRCQECGYAFPVKARKGPDVVDGELTEITKEQRAKMQARQQQGRSQTLEDLILLGRQRGYKRPELWARHIFQARQVRKLRGY